MAGHIRETDNKKVLSLANQYDEQVVEVRRGDINVSGGSISVSGSVTIPPATAFVVKGMDVDSLASQVDTSLLANVKFVQIKADLDNTKPIYFSHSALVSISGVDRGFQLNNGEAETLPVASGVNIYVIAEDTSQKIMYSLFNGGI